MQVQKLQFAYCINVQKKNAVYAPQ